jgi:acyl-CoA thioesterase-1
MKLFLWLSALVVLISLAACREEPPKSPPPANSASSAPEAPRKSLPKIVAFGDSLTAGLGLEPSQSYPELLQKRLDVDGFNYEVVNAGISGDTSAGGVRRIDWTLADDVDFVILELGANDILRGQPIDQMKKNLGQIIERIKAKGAEVLLAGMEAPTNSGPEYRKQTHDAFVELASQYDVELIPFFLEGVAGEVSMNQSDGIHPNSEGTRRVTETVYKSLRPLLEKRRSKSSL